MTLGVFSCVTTYLQKMAKGMGANHGWKPIMSEYMTRFNARMTRFNALLRFNAANLLERLESKGLTANEEVADFVIGQQQERALPFYVRTLVTAGAFIAWSMLSFTFY